MAWILKPLMPQSWPDDWRRFAALFWQPQPIAFEPIPLTGLFQLVLEKVQLALLDLMEVMEPVEAIRYPTPEPKAKGRGVKRARGGGSKG